MEEATRAKVLVVDDEEPVRSVLCETLVEAGEEVISAADGQEALELLSTDDVGVMLLDISMPGLPGLDVLAEVRSRSPETSVIMVTAVADLATGVNAIRQGAYDYVTKPFDVDAIATAVQRAHERRNLFLLDRRHKRELEEKLGEQADRLQAQFVQLISSLAREHDLVLTVESLGRSKRDRSALSALPPQLRSPQGSVRRFAEALEAAIRSGSLATR